MPHNPLEIAIGPQILVWARETIGLDVTEVAKKLQTSEDIISKWENGQKNPTLTQIEKLANIYKRPLATFFLPTPPQEPSFPKDFRALPQDKRKPFTSKTRLAVRRARRLQSLAVELANGLNHKIVVEIGKANLSDNPEKVASQVRERLGIGIQEQLRWRTERQAFDEWKKAVEKCGAFVFQMSMPLEETRGFSLPRDTFPIIVLNLRDAIRGQIFSILHEYGHLLLEDAGICNMRDEDYLHVGYKSTEKFCNHFAGAVLVPGDALTSHELVKDIKSTVEWSDEDLEKLAQEFRVSRQVILRRLVILGRANSAFYKKKQKEWESLTPPQKKWGRRNPPKQCIRNTGIPFISLVLESQRGEKITYKDAADYLSIRLKYLPKVEELIGGKSYL
jgi:Zn-dependent peptidase ImmA (M78 family)/DNA-binding XRE family transcriptional regulator